MELRKLAGALDAQADAEVVKPWITFYTQEKEPFLALARLMPRPLEKKVEDENSDWARLKVICKGFEAIDVTVSVPQSKTCELIEPAKPAVYRCDSILSEVEEETVAR